MSPYPQVDFGHTSYDAAFGRGDVYDVAIKPERASKRPLTVAIAGCGGVAQAKWIPAIRRLQTIGEPLAIVGVADPDENSRSKASLLCMATGFSGLHYLITGRKYVGLA